MKGERIAQMELLLHSHPEGLHRAEIARRLGVHRSTISRYVNELKGYIGIYEENNLIKIKNDASDSNIDLSVYESLALNMSAEALAHQMEFQNPHLASGLRKIAMNMRSYAPKVSDNIIQLAEHIDEKAQKQSSRYSSILDVLIDSWVSGRIVKIMQKNQKEIELAPYFIGFTEDEHSRRNPISVTGRLRHTEEIITVDISTITGAKILDETYTIPDNLKPFKIKEQNLNYRSGDTVPLKLKIRELSALNAFHSLEHTPWKVEKYHNFHIASSNVENSIHLTLRLLQCGSSVEILEPAKYRKKFCSYLTEILNIYT